MTSGYAALKFGQKVDRLRALNGLFPVYKPAGVSMLDVRDWVKLTVEFESGQILMNSISHKLAYWPWLMTSDEGLVNFAIGNKNKWISGFKHVKLTYEFQAQMGPRHEFLAHDQVLFRPFDHVTDSSLSETMASFLGTKPQVPGPRDKPLRTYVTAEPWAKAAPVRSINFYEGTPPKMVTLHEISQFKFDPPFFSARIVACGSFCLRRFVDDVARNLGTNAVLDQVKMYCFS